jgi:hypothetical protein
MLKCIVAPGSEIVMVGHGPAPATAVIVGWAVVQLVNVNNTTPQIALNQDCFCLISPPLEC